MPARIFVWLLLIVIAAAGLTIAAAQIFGLPTAALGLVGVCAALALRLWMMRE